MVPVNVIAGDRGRPRILLVISRGFPHEWADEIDAEMPGAEFVRAADNAEAIDRAVPGVDAMINCPRPLFSAELLRRAGNNLRWIHLGGAGCEEYLIPELVNSPITLTIGKILQGPPVADHAMALLLALTCRLNLVLRGRSHDIPRPIELHDKTLIVIGVGGVGMLIAERARAFGMKVIGVDAAYVPMLSIVEAVHPPERLIEVLPEADAVIMAAPRTAASHRMMGGDEFAAMKRSAYFINVSRGATVDTEALVAALRAGALQGAGLDVTDPEPLPDDHPLRHMDNVVITPHIAGLSDHNRRRSFALIKENVQRFAAGRPLFNVVNKELGY